MAGQAELDAVRRAVALSASALGATSPNPPVGAVVLDAHGEVVGEGWTAPPGGPHAEVVALRAAGESEARWAAGRPIGPLDGVPATVKDLVDLAGFPTRRGSRLTDPAPVSDDAPLTTGLKNAGAVILGKTHTTEFGWKTPGDCPLGGITRNAWNPDRTVGGSSSGAGAAGGVAAAADVLTATAETPRNPDSRAGSCRAVPNACAAISVTGCDGVAFADADPFCAVLGSVRGCRSNDDNSTAPMAIPPPKDASKELEIGA